MKTTMKALLLGLSLASASVTSFAAQAEQKVGYVNTARVFQALPQREVAVQTIQNEFKDRAQELQQMEKDIKENIDKLQRDQALMSSDEIEQLRIKIGELDSRYKVKVQAFKNASAKREQEENQKLFKIIGDAVNSIASKENYDLIIDAQALRYAKPEFDISDQVIQALK